MSRVVSNSLLAVAGVFMLASLFYENVDLSSQDYRGVLLKALVAMMVADLLCLHHLFRGGGARRVAVLIALPSLFVLWDLARRAPYAWRMF